MASKSTMTVKLVDSGWSGELRDGVRAYPNSLRIISPFIKSRAAERLLAYSPKHVQVITRFDLADFVQGVSDIEALRVLLDAGAAVRGIRNLHAKLYLFGRRRTIVTSANLTSAALDSNHEFGLVSEDPSIMVGCESYFADLWRRAGSDLTAPELDRWHQTVASYQATGIRKRPDDLPDYGADVGLPPSSNVKIPPLFSEADQAFVKFLGQSRKRAPLSFQTIEEIDRAQCHWAVAYPEGKRPRAVADGALIFIARLVAEPNDIRIFGRAIGMRHVPGRDDATPEEVERREWKRIWPHYVRVHHADFVAGTLANAISLNELMDELGADAFASTQRNARRGKGNTNPRHAYLRQAAVELSAEGLAWLLDRLQAAFDAHGKVPQDELDALYTPSSPTISGNTVG